MVESHIVNADIVLIPTADHPWTKCKSPNRAVDAIHAGKFVITDNADIYGDLQEFIAIVEKPEDIPEVIKWWQENPGEVAEKVTAGQKYIQETYGDAVILDAWLDILQDLGLIKTFEEIHCDAEA